MAVGWLGGWLLLGRASTWSRSSVMPHRSLSVVIPVRDEAHNLPGVLASLRTQREPAGEVIVVDDGSTDRTKDVAGTIPGVRLIDGEPLPPGWTGKSWACWQGASAARGEVLLFVDADVRLGPEAIASAQSELSRQGGLVSVQPLHTIGRALEALSMPFNIVAVMGVGVSSLVRPRRQRAAAGPFMLCQRADYDRVGGHRAVKGAIAEDMALGREFDRAGLHVTCLAGPSDVRFRMYPGGLGDLVRGWSKNFATGAALTARWRTALIAAWITAALVATFFLGRVVSTPLAVGIVYALFTVQWAAFGHRVGRFRFAALLWPLLTVFFVVVFAWSVVSTYALRRVSWRGRVVATAPSDRH
jgi:4,4'-diaponeurosporenoate glycosyltransferase